MAGRVLISTPARHTAPCKSPPPPRAAVLPGTPLLPRQPPRRLAGPAGPGLKVAVLHSGGSAESGILLEC